MLDKETTKDFALANGFTLKEQTNGNWISVDDALPNHDDFCKVITVYDDVLDCHFYDYIDDYGDRLTGFSWVTLDIDKEGKLIYTAIEGSLNVDEIKYFIILPQPFK